MYARTKKLTLVFVLGAIFVILGPAIFRTIYVASSADELLMLSSFSEEDFSLNPWSQNCYLIRPDTAAAILRNFDWPYSRRSKVNRDHEPAPLIHQAINSRGLTGLPSDEPYDSIEDQRLMSLLRHFVEKGLSIDELWGGYAPIHAAMLAGDAEVVEFLIEHGASLQSVINNPGGDNDGMNSFEFSEWLVATRPQEFQEISSILFAAKNE